MESLVLIGRTVGFVIAVLGVYRTLFGLRLDWPFHIALGIGLVLSGAGMVLLSILVG